MTFRSSKPLPHTMIAKIRRNGHHGEIRRRDRMIGGGTYAHCDICNWDSRHWHADGREKARAAFISHAAPPAPAPVAGTGTRAEVA